jgi:hypothetical protein
MTRAQRRQALLDAFDVYEEMTALIACLARSPAVWTDGEPDDITLYGDLEQRGLLQCTGEFYTTTEKGRAALIAYINGEDESAYLDEFCDGLCEQGE